MLAFGVWLSTNLISATSTRAQDATSEQESSSATRVVEDTSAQSAREQSERSLKAVVGDRFKIGVGISHRVVGNEDDATLLLKHFQIITPENCMKPQGIHPAEERWEFEATDRFMDFARKNQVEAVGHCLVWAKDDRTDQWMMTDADGQPLTKATLLRRIEHHVETVVKRYADVVTMWDVVNEAIGDSDEGLLRDSIYSRTSEMEFVATAFKTARNHDPDALLIYNDYNGHKPGKREKLLEFLTELQRMEVPVDAYGMQGHFELSDNSLQELRETFDELRKLGLKVVVSELDIDVVKRGRWWADGGKYREELATFDPYKDGLPADIEKQESEQYVALFQLFDEYRDVIARVSFWNLHDGHSWLNYFPWQRTNYPLLFDRNRQPKPVFDAVYEALESTGREKASNTSHSQHGAWPRNDENSKIAHEQLVQKAKQGQIDVYFQGDSITRRWGATDYPELLAHWKKNFYGWNAANFAWGGDSTQHILWRMRNGELDGLNPKVVVLQAGTNNLPWRGPADEKKVDEVVQGVNAILAEFQMRTPEAKIVLTGLFPRPQNPSLASAIQRINKRLEVLADGDKVRYLNINSDLVDSKGEFRPGVSSDGLHLDAAGYDVWAAALKPLLKEWLGEPSDKDNAPPPTGNPAAAK